MTTLATIQKLQRIVRVIRSTNRLSQLQTAELFASAYIAQRPPSFAIRAVELEVEHLKTKINGNSTTEEEKEN